MIQKSLLHIVTMGLVVIALTACGGKGIDRKLDYSGTAEELGKSYGEAMADATPEQQNILREHIYTILPTVLSLAKNSNPVNVEAFVAKKNTEEFDKVKNMSVRELFVWFFKKRQDLLNTSINTANKFRQEKPLQVEKISIESMECQEVANSHYSSQPHPCRVLRIDGVIFLRNTSDAKVALDECQLALVLDGKPIEKASRVSNCSGLFDSKGGAKTVKFGDIHGYGGEPDAEVINHIYELYKNGNAASIAWAFTPSFYLVNAEGHRVELDDKSMEQYKAELAEIAADLAAMKK